MLSSAVSGGPRSEPLRDRLGRLAAGRLSDREKPMAEPNDWGIFMAEEPLVTLGLEQSEERRRSEEGFRFKLDLGKFLEGCLAYTT